MMTQLPIVPIGSTCREHCLQSWMRAVIDGKNGFVTEPHASSIRRIAVRFGTYQPDTNRNADSRVTVEYQDGETFSWETRHLSVYNDQFGVSASEDGTLVFAQTWECGLYALDARTGATVWRSASRKGVTSLYVNRTSVLSFQHEKALQLLDIRNGALLKEKKPASAWGFYVLAEDRILCRTRSNLWEIIRPSDLETILPIPAKSFPTGSLREIRLTSPDTLSWKGYPGADASSGECEGTVRLPVCVL